MPDSLFVKKYYIMQKLLDDFGHVNWVTNVKQLLYRHGFGYIWINQDVQNGNAFLNILVQRLRDHSAQTWSSDIEQSSKLDLYRNFKLNFEHESYLNCLNIRKFRHVMSKFRSGCHNLEIEIGRHDKRERNERICRLCNSSVEDEAHFLLYCPVYLSLRQKYLPRKYYLEPNINKFYILMSSKSESV